MATAQSFPPIVGKSPKILILGSAPGVISLKKQQYFAHPRNTFWPILAELFDIDISQGYEHSVAQCQELPIIIWDALKRCERQGSLDQDIKNESVVANNIKGLIDQFPDVKQVFCNGAASYKWFIKLSYPDVKSKELQVKQLPSTSPAHAAMNFEEKLMAWKIIVKEMDMNLQC